MPIEFIIRGDHIQLDQLMKATGLVSSGGMAHALISDGRVQVDGQVETRKRAKLRPGQRVRYLQEEIVLAGTAPPAVTS
jgi:ribosome-associated protein